MRQELRRAEGVLVERRQLVLLVRAPPRRGVAPGLRVRGHVEHAQVECHRRSQHELRVVGLLGQEVQRRDVLQHVDVAVPFEEAELAALANPFEDVGLGARHVLGAGEPGDAERVIRIALSTQVLDDLVDDDAVSYTHLTLPTSDLVKISVVAVPLKKKYM
mgnify:CR=1 FL=1